MTDNELINDILEHNSQKAFEEIVNRYQALVTKTCRGFVHSYADAEDIAQEVFIEVYQSLSKFRGESKFSTWVYRIAVNKSLNHIRKQQKHKTLRRIEDIFAPKDEMSKPRDIEDHYSPRADDRIEQDENKKMLRNAINRLPKNQRTAFVLNKYQDLAYKEIAEVMELTLSSVESLLFRAKRNLQSHLLKEMQK
ncbi:MAG TPA: sigma-70 family RNA polymerase sigma factor [Perlabentimonas sp.]|jgi:RNA polymerase sigma-70 factor (ECF subfamily)|nr:sigma-70 family RNA polymerase sigma factor [Bacteroidales bacterium]MDD4673556.1 sigma-70 family RNA polymerase sigma factor [Bacteroidales bacterium]MDY0349107.1 sigma-70 family RNA polymerase sigma factor [Tenuifilaceae bacterium]HZJ73763.1 sigma-70 family RNA polymerase sigma factor [Perlabentimonas sp.]